MALGSTQNTVAETYSKLKLASEQTYNYCEQAVTYLSSGNIAYSYLTTQLIPTLRSQLASLPSSSGFPAEWITKLSEYAATQTLTPSADFQTDYESVRTAISDAIAQAVSDLPKSGGKIAIQSFDPSGVETVDKAASLPDLITKLEAVKTAAA